MTLTPEQLERDLDALDASLRGHALVDTRYNTVLRAALVQLRAEHAEMRRMHEPLCIGCQGIAVCVRIVDGATCRDRKAGT